MAKVRERCSVERWGSRTGIPRYCNASIRERPVTISTERPSPCLVKRSRSPSEVTENAFVDVETEGPGRSGDVLDKKTFGME